MNDIKLSFSIATLFWLIVTSALFFAWVFVPPPFSRKPLVPVLVASRNLNTGTELTKLNVEIREFPDNLVPAGVVNDFSQIEFMAIVGNRVRGEFIFFASVYDPKSLSAGSIPAGHRVINLRIHDDVDDLLLQLLRAGDRVSLSTEAGFLLETAEVFNVEKTRRRLSVLVTETEAQAVVLGTKERACMIGKPLPRIQ